MKIKKLLNNSAFKTGAVLAVAFLWACGEPLEPSPNGWHIAYDGMPGDRLAVSGGDIFTVKALEGLGQTNTIYKFDGVKVTADFVGNPEYKFNDVAFRGTPGWAGGYKETTPPLYEKPVLVRREGAMWREENLPASEVKAIDRVYPISGNSCWLLIHTYSPYTHCFALWDRTHFRVFRSTGDIDDGAFEAATGTLYGWRNNPAGVGFFIYVTADGGETWRRETLASVGGGTVVNTIIDGAAPGGELLLAADISINDVAYDAVIKRTGAPGQGDYHLFFFSPLGPKFRQIDAIDFINANRGVAAGWNTSATFDGSVWRLEETDMEFYIDDITNDGATTFWAIGYNTLYYHP